MVIYLAFYISFGFGRAMIEPGWVWHSFNAIIQIIRYATAIENPYTRHAAGTKAYSVRPLGITICLVESCDGTASKT